MKPKCKHEKKVYRLKDMKPHWYCEACNTLIKATADEEAVWLGGVECGRKLEEADKAVLLRYKQLRQILLELLGAK